MLEGRFYQNDGRGGGGTNAAAYNTSITPAEIVLLDSVLTGFEIREQELALHAASLPSASTKLSGSSNGNAYAISADNARPLVDDLSFGRSLPTADESHVWKELKKHGLSEDSSIALGWEILKKYCHDDRRDNGMLTLNQHIYPIVIDYLKDCENKDTQAEKDIVVVILLHDLAEKYIKNSEDRKIAVHALNEAFGEKIANLLDLLTKPIDVTFEKEINEWSKSEEKKNNRPVSEIEIKEKLRSLRLNLYIDRMEASEYAEILFMIKGFDRVNNLRCSISNANWKRQDFAKLEAQIMETEAYLSAPILRARPDDENEKLVGMISEGKRVLKAAEELHLFTPRAIAA